MLGGPASRVAALRPRLHQIMGGKLLVVAAPLEAPKGLLGCGFKFWRFDFNVMFV